MISRSPWGFSRSIEKAGLQILTFLFFLTPAVTDGAPNPHAFMEDPSGCLDCHETLPVKPGGLFVRDTVSLCMDCHPISYRMSHPVDIRPQEPVRNDLPLGRDGEITCSTCHDPHSDPFSTVPYVNRGLVQHMRGMFSFAGYPTCFIRMPNTRGELCLSCHAGMQAGDFLLRFPTDLNRDYTGSKACERCHKSIFKEWKRTLHARTAQDPRENPNAVSALFTGDQSFKPEEIDIVIGVHRIQRYVIQRGGTMKITPEIWSLVDSSWGKPSRREQSWGDHCAGCHLTGYDPYERSYVEKGVGCEMCHGPGGKHVRSGIGGNIVDPGRIGRRLADSICASCHTSGHDPTGQFRFPVGYLPGQELSPYYRGLLPNAGPDKMTFKGDGTLDERLRSFDFWLSQLYNPSRDICRQGKNAQIRSLDGQNVKMATLTPAEYCLSCHEKIKKDQQHELISAQDAGCFNCHTPLRDKAGKPSIHDHKYVYGR